VVGLKLDSTLLMTSNAWIGETDVDIAFDPVPEESELTAEVVSDLKRRRHGD